MSDAQPPPEETQESKQDDAPPPPPPPAADETPKEEEVKEMKGEDDAGEEEEEEQAEATPKTETAGEEEEDDGEEEEGEDGAAEEDLEEPSIRASAPAPTPQLEDGTEDDLRPMGMGELKAAIDSAVAKLEGMSTTDFLLSLQQKTDIHAHAVLSAKKIAKTFVDKAADLAAAMQMILQYDQLMLKKLNLTTAYDFGIKPKTDDGEFLLHAVSYVRLKFNV